MLLSRHATEKYLARTRLMPFLSICIGILIIFYIYIIHSTPIIENEVEILKKIKKDEWLMEIKENKDDITNILRGIIICVFDAMIPIAASLILELRMHGNHDLIQIYHCNGELSPSSQRILYMIDTKLEIIDGCKEYIASGKLPRGKANDFKSFWLKPLALSHTRLHQVLLLDADDLLFRDPGLLFDVPGYIETGTIFFYDREVAKEEYLNSYTMVRFQRMTCLHALIESFNYAKFGLVKNPSTYLQSTLAWKGESAHEQDSSIVVINKAKSQLAMDILWELTLYDRYNINFSYGDKEVFWLAFELAHLPYYFSPWANTAAARPGNMEKHPDTICGGLAQWMPLPNSKNELLHINGGYIFNPYINNDINSMKNEIKKSKELIQNIPKWISKQRKRSIPLTKPEDNRNPDGYWPQECLYKRGSEAMRPEDIASIERRIYSTISIAKLQQREVEIDKKRDESKIIG